VSFGIFHGNPMGDMGIGSSIIVNGKEESELLTSYDPNPVFPIIKDAEFTIGAINSESFKGSIGFIEIFTPGSVIQTSKIHLFTYF